MKIVEFKKLLYELAQMSSETEWVEFKTNRIEPEEIGENISAISNSSALFSKQQGYIVWGISDGSQELIGTNTNLKNYKIGNEELENWLLRLLEPRIDFRIFSYIIDDKQFCIIVIPAASKVPVKFKKQAFIRIGSYTKKLIDYPEKERALWRVFDQTQFEYRIARDNLSETDILELLNYPKYFALLQQPLPENRKSIIERMISEKIVVLDINSQYNITNVGALLFAKNLNDFERLYRKALRIIIYKGNNRVDTIKEGTGSKGYATGFQGAIQYINDQLPQNEQIEQAFRREVRMYPEIAIRELVANALIHQDFNISGAGPLVEIFKDRMEISNPGIPLIDPLRFIDEPPRSRNEALASFMRRMAICEERGSGIDKVVFSVEAFQLPAPDFRIAGSSTIAVLFGPRKFAQMNRDERIRACYQHACLQYVSGQKMSNKSLRKRLGIKETNYPSASRVIKDTIDSQLIKTSSGGSDSKRDATYVPFWA